MAEIYKFEGKFNDGSWYARVLANDDQAAITLAKQMMADRLRSNIELYGDIPTVRNAHQSVNVSKQVRHHSTSTDGLRPDTDTIEWVGIAHVTPY